MVLAAAGRYRTLRIVTASAVALAAAGWLAARLGVPNAVQTAADGIGTVSFPLAALLWITAITIYLRPKAKRPMLSGAAKMADL